MSDRRKFQPGDRVKGIRSHKGKTGTIISYEWSSFVSLKWDNGKRKSNVEIINIEPLDQESA
jgi:hypothetical protein